MRTSYHPIEPQELMAYLDGELPAERAGVTAEHLERCAECQELAAQLGGVRQRLLNWRIETPDQQVARSVAAALAESAAKTPGAVRRAWWEGVRRRAASPWVWAPACLVLVMMVVSGPTMMNRRKEASQSLDFVRTGPVPSKLQMSEAIPAASEPAKSNSPLIARTAQLQLTTKDFDKVRPGIDEILKRHGGYVGQLEVRSPGSAGRSLEAALRMPADRLDAVMAEFKKLGRVESESQSGEEVTQQYVDLEARLSNARNAERRLTDLLSQRTGKLADVLAVEVEIDRTRGEIERMEAERKSLAKRVAFATLQVRVREDYAAQLEVTPDSMSTRFRNAAVEGYRSMAESVFAVALFFLSNGPTLALWGALLFSPGRMVWRRWRRRRD